MQVSLKQKDEKEKEKERQKEKEEAKKAKKTLRHFSDRVFMLPDVQGWRGFIESNEAKAALGLVQDLPFSSAYHESLGLYDHVTFTVRRGLSGLEAVDLVAQRLVVGLAFFLIHLGCHALEIWIIFRVPRCWQFVFGVLVSPDE